MGLIKNYKNTMMLVIVIILNAYISCKNYLESSISGYLCFNIIIFAIINSILIFSVVYLIFRRYSYSLFSVISFGMINISNEAIQISLGIAFLLLISVFYLLWESKGEYRFFLLSILAGTLSLFFYPQSAIFIASFIIPYLFIYRSDLVSRLYRNKEYLFSIVSFVVIIGILALFIVLKAPGFITESLKEIQFQKLSPVFYYGIIPFIFSICGISYIILREKNKLLFTWLIISLLHIYLFYVLNHTFLIMFNTLFMFYLVCLSMLSGIGAGSLIIMFDLLVKRKSVFLTAKYLIILIFLLPYLLLVKP